MRNVNKGWYVISAIKFALIFNDQNKVTDACQRQLIKSLALSDDMLTVQWIEAERIFYEEIITQPFNREHHKKTIKDFSCKGSVKINQSKECDNFLIMYPITAQVISSSYNCLITIKGCVWLKGKNPFYIDSLIFQLLYDWFCLKFILKYIHSKNIASLLVRK